MAKNYYELEEEAKFWLKDKIDEGRIVFEKSELDSAIYNYLKSKTFIVDLYGNYFFIKQDNITELEAFELCYWKIVIQFLNLRFADPDDKNPTWYLVGKYPYDFLVEKILIPDISEQITVQTKHKSNTKIKLFHDHTIVAVQDRTLDEKTIVRFDIFGDYMNILKQEFLIASSTKTQYQLYEENIVAYLKNSNFDHEYLEDYFKRHNAPVYLARFIGALKQVGEQIQALKFEELFRSLNYKKGIENPFSREYKFKKTSKPSYVTRYRLSMQNAKKYLKTLDLPRRLSSRVDNLTIDKLSTDDAYHSLTIEGYEVTKQILMNLQAGTTVDTDLKNKSAAKGFLKVLEFIKQIITVDFDFNRELTEEIWKQLWSPSINSGLFRHELSIYRNHMVSIRGSQSVPPGHEKIFYLLDLFYEELEEIENGFERAIFLHFFYVWIHPHSDGNGRISRFLMNLSLICDNYRWLTIPNYERQKYFKSLEKSQVEDDISYFADYILELYKEKPEL